MADVGLRDLGGFGPRGTAVDRAGDRSREPVVPPLQSVPAPSDVIVTPPPRAQRAIFGDPRSADIDALGVDDTLGHFAELAAHRGTAAALCIGLLGGPGTGKSFALERLAQHIRALAGAASKASQSPFLSRIHVQPIDAAGLEGDPALAIAAKLHGGLAKPYPDLAHEIGHAARDPHVVLRETNERLDDARRRLDSERRALDDAGSRRARLVETVLYEAAGSQVDAYARANRAGIENRLGAFGIYGDPIRNYKDLVQLVAGSGGRIGLSLRALWAFKGQTKLIVAAIVLVGIGVGLGIAIDDQTRWLDELRSGPQAGANVASWFSTHMGLLASAKTGAFVLAVVALAANLYRAFAFLQPILKGARLLESDLDNRRRDLDGLYAHQTKRVDTLDADVERLTRESADAERRAGGGTTAMSAPSPFQPDAATQAQGFFAALGAMMAGTGGPSAPQRIVLAIDHLDAVSPDRARAILDTLHRTAGPGLLTIVAADADRLAQGGHDDLERWIQVPLRLDAGSSDRDYGSLVQAALGHSGASPARRAPDATKSALDRPVGDDEATLLTALAGLAGRSPRAVGRFVSLYTLARHDGDVSRGALALMLALAQGGTAGEKAAVAAALEGDQASGLDLSQASPRLRDALDAVTTIDGRFTTADAAKAASRAAQFSFA